MSWLNFVLIAYAVLVLAGGIFGYAAKGSVPSLVSSLAAAILVVAAVWLSGQNKSLGYGLAAFVAAALAIFFGIRLLGGSVMPGLPALLMSVAVIGCLIAGHFANR